MLYAIRRFTPVYLLFHECLLQRHVITYLCCCLFAAALPARRRRLRAIRCHDALLFARVRNYAARAVAALRALSATRQQRAMSR